MPNGGRAFRFRAYPLNDGRLNRTPASADHSSDSDETYNQKTAYRATVRQLDINREGVRQEAVRRRTIIFENLFPPEQRPTWLQVGVIMHIVDCLTDVYLPEGTVDSDSSEE